MTYLFTDFLIDNFGVTYVTYTFAVTHRIFRKKKKKKKKKHTHNVEQLTFFQPV